MTTIARNSKITAPYNAFGTGSYTFKINPGFAEDVIVKPAFAGAMEIVAKYCTQIPGIIAGKQVPVITRPKKFTKKESYGGIRNAPSMSSKMKVDEFTWDPQPVKIALSETYQDLEDTFFVWLTNAGIDRHNLTQTEYMTFWADMLTQGIADDFSRIVFFGDKNAATPPLTNAGAIEDYEQVDGFWKQFFAQGSLNPSQVYTIAENGAATTAEQLNLSPTTAVTIFSSMIGSKNGVRLDSRLRSRKDKVFLCTNTIETNYREYLDSKEIGESFGYLQKGAGDVVYYNGIPVIGVQQWDDTIAEDFDNGTTLQAPHRVVLCTADNLLVGTDYNALDELSQLKIVFDELDEKNYAKGGYKTDVKIPHPELLGFAY